MTKELRFIVNGCIATSIHTLVVFAMVQIRHDDQSVANAIAFLVATGVSYLANTVWTFETKHTPGILLRYLVVACVGSIFSYFIATFCSALGFMWWMSVILIVAIVPVFTWLAHNKWTYAR